MVAIGPYKVLPWRLFKLRPDQSLTRISGFTYSVPFFPSTLQFQMSGLEAAASLFGSEDSNSDPFASLGSESQHTDAVHGASDDLFAANRTSSPAPDFLGEPQTYSEPVEQHNTWPETNSYEPAAHNVYSSPEQNYGTQQSAQDYGTHQSTQNHGEQWQNYSQNDPYAAPGQLFVVFVLPLIDQFFFSLCQWSGFSGL
jgi:hypothetical protein